MRKISEADLNAGLSAIKESRRPKTRTNAREILAKRFRHGIDVRRKALEQRATIVQPYEPTFIVLNPFLIWANRFLGQSNDPLGTDILIDWQIEALNNWAKILLN